MSLIHEIIEVVSGVRDIAQDCMDVRAIQRWKCGKLPRMGMIRRCPSHAWIIVILQDRHRKFKIFRIYEQSWFWVRLRDPEGTETIISEKQYYFLLRICDVEELYDRDVFAVRHTSKSKIFGDTIFEDDRDDLAAFEESLRLKMQLVEKINATL